MKKNFFDIGISRYSGLAKQSSFVVRYLATHRDIVLSEKELTPIVSIRPMLKTPMSDLFDHIAGHGKLSSYASIFVPSTSTSDSLPELIATSGISLDLKDLPDGSSLKTMPEYANKMLVNLSNVLKVNKMSGLSVANIEALHRQYVRGMIIMSYNDQSSCWLTPQLAEFLIKSYTMIISGIIANRHNLTFQEQGNVMMILAFFMSQMIDDVDADPWNPPLFYRCTFAGSRIDLENAQKRIVESLEELAIDKKENMSIDSVARLIAKTGPERMARFSGNEFFEMTKTIGENPLISKIAVEYPPYWLFLLIVALSGSKLPMLYHLNQVRLTQEAKSTFIPKLITSPALMGHVDRNR